MTTESAVKPRASFAELLAVYLKPRVLIVLFLGFSSGLPLALSGSTLLVWMRESGVDLGTIGLFALVGTPYTIKFLWAPVVDALDVPVLAKLLGRRRGWLVLSQLLLIAAIVFLAFTNPAAAPGLVALGALLVATASATQDIVIDAFRIDTLDESEQAAGMASYVAAYRIGTLVSTAGALYIVTGFESGLGFDRQTAWTFGYLAMALMVVIGIITTLLATNPEKREGGKIEDPEGGRLARVWKAALGAFSEFLTRDAAILVLAFVILYKFCDAFAGTMTTPFIIDLGFSRTDYANIVKGVGLAATLIGGFAGGAVARALPLTTCLWIGAILQSVSNLVFVWLAQVGTNTWALTAAVIAENFTGAIGTVIFVAYLSALCKNPLHTATQFALLTALSAFGRTYLSAGAGFVAQGRRLAAVLCLERGRRDPELHPARLAAGARAFQDARGLDQRPLPDRRRERAFVEIIELAADRHAMRQPRHLHFGIVQQVGDVMRRGLPVDRGIERQDHFFHGRIVRARHQRVDGEILRADTIQRRERAAEHVIARIHRIGAFQRPKVGDVRDHHDQRRIALVIGADRAGIMRVDIAADRADHDLLARGLDRVGERRHQLLALLDQMQGRAPRRARPEARQAREQLDQAFDFGTGGASGHGRCILQRLGTTTHIAAKLAKSMAAPALHTFWMAT